MTNVSSHDLDIITDAGELLILLFEHLDRKEPRVPVSSYVGVFVELIYSIAGGSSFDPSRIEMDSMFAYDDDPQN